MYVDSHCHLSFPELHDRIDEVRSAMAEAQVDRALVICTTLEEFDAVPWRCASPISGPAPACTPTTRA
jgi:Tat protein secretion system quality control protein TatD with DNase activity